jgi:hypothetical protein
MPPAACFIHVFKTGGTTISNWLSRHYPASAVPPDPDTYAANPAAYDAPLLRGHIYAADVVALKGRVLLTVLRNPQAQIMSALWHLASGHLIDLYHPQFSSTSDAAVIEMARRCATTPVGQARFFSPPGTLSAIDVVGLTERMPDTMRLFAWKLGLPAPQKGTLVLRRSGAGDASMPAEVRDLMKHEITRDEALYAEAKERFEHAFAELASAAGSDNRSDIDGYLSDRAGLRSLRSRLGRYLPWRRLFAGRK